MKNILFVITACALLTFSSCYVGVRGGPPHPPRRAKGVIIIADNPAKDSSKSTTANVNQNDSIKSVADPAVVK